MRIAIWNNWIGFVIIFFKNIANIFQIGYFLNTVIKNKNKNFPNSISAELSKPFYHNIFNDKYKLHGLLALVSLLNISIIEGQKVSGLFNLSEIIFALSSAEIEPICV